MQSHTSQSRDPALVDAGPDHRKSDRYMPVRIKRLGEEQRGFRPHTPLIDTPRTKCPAVRAL